MTKEFFIEEKSSTFKSFKSLVDDKKSRYDQELVILFGEKTLIEFKDKLQAIITTEKAKHHPDFSHLDRYLLKESAFKKLSSLVTPEPYAGLIKRPKNPMLGQIKKGVLILDGLNDPGNMGTLFRTAFGLGLDAICITPNTVDPYHEKVLRASKGLTLKMPWYKLDLEGLKKKAADWHLTLYRAELEGTALEKVHPSLPFGLILGNEAQGVSQEMQVLGQPIHIPQKNLESLNVAIAGAIISYTLLYGSSHAS